MAGAEAIKDFKSFENWLDARPKVTWRADGAVLASRCALRMLPLAGGATFGREYKRYFAASSKVLFWQNTISRSVRAWPDRETTAAAYAAYAHFPHAVFIDSTADDARVVHATRAVGFAASFATDADNAATAATSAAAAARAAGFDAADVWESIRIDAGRIEAGEEAFSLFSRSIWQDEPKWWRDARDVFKKRLADTDVDWSIWLGWYDTVAQGKPAFGLSRKAGDALERAIALGERDGKFHPEFWDREPGEINREIAEWVTEAWAAENAVSELPKPVFISYTEADKTHAERIGGVIEGDGYRVFAQFKDMPPGSSFVAEMQNGLADMGKFAPLYSPEYVASSHCQAEWNAAYNMDPVGKRQLIVGFLMRKTELLPLQRQIVHVPLMGLTEEQARNAILKALRDSGAKRTPLESRQAAKDYAIPDTRITGDGKLSFVPDSEVEQPFLDDAISRLPRSMLGVINVLLASDTGQSNRPPIVRSLLETLHSEITMNGAAAHVPDLDISIAMLRAELSKADSYAASWHEGAVGVGLTELFRLFENYRQNYPLVMLRDIERRQAAIDPKVFDSKAFQDSHQNIQKATEQLFADGKADESFLHGVSLRQKQRKNISDFENYVPQKSDRFVANPEERSVDELKKDFLFDESGTWDRTLGRVEKVTSIVDSSTGKALIVWAKEITKAIWGG